jgi:hypothetical protein
MAVGSSKLNRIWDIMETGRELFATKESMWPWSIGGKEPNSTLSLRALNFNLMKASLWYLLKPTKGWS